MVAFKQVAILGLGFIGTSLALALRRASEGTRVMGYDVNSASIDRATRLAAVDRTFGTIAEVCKDSECVVLAAPVRAILQLLPEVAPHLSPGAVVTDIGGTKHEINRIAELELPATSPFIRSQAR
jgi:prephenate dehydrogenase